MRNFIRLLFFCILISSLSIKAQEVAILKYQGGGDWYANPTALPNLIKFCNNNIGTTLSDKPETVEVGSSSIFQYPFINLPQNKKKVWLTWVSNNSQLNEGLTILIDNLQGYCSVYNKVGNFLGNLELNENLKIENSLTLIDILSSTGLQIKADPGILFIYSGFLLLMLSTLISYITYSQIWIVQEKKKIFIGGNTTRATFEFELEFLKLVK